MKGTQLVTLSIEEGYWCPPFSRKKAGYLGLSLSPAKSLHTQFYTLKFLKSEYVAIKSKFCVFLWVNLSVCPCVSALLPKQMNYFWWNFIQNQWSYRYLTSTFFADLLISYSMTPWWPYYFFNLVLSISDFC